MIIITISKIWPMINELDCRSQRYNQIKFWEIKYFIPCIFTLDAHFTRQMDLVCDRAIFKSSAQMAFFIGYFIGSFISGIISDR